MYLNVALLNHSCGPNAFVEKTEDETNEVRAIKDILKGEEVTIFYNWSRVYTYLRWKEKQRMEVIKDNLGFTCNCCVCFGKLPGQEDISKELVELSEALYDKEQCISDCVNTMDKIVELSLRLYVGHINDKLRALVMMAELAFEIRDEECLGKVKRQLKKLADDTKLKCAMRNYENIMNKFPHA